MATIEVRLSRLLQIPTVSHTLPVDRPSLLRTSYVLHRLHLFGSKGENFLVLNLEGAERSTTRNPGARAKYYIPQTPEVWKCSLINTQYRYACLYPECPLHIRCVDGRLGEGSNFAD